MYGTHNAYYKMQNHATIVSLENINILYDVKINCEIPCNKVIVSLKFL